MSAKFITHKGKEIFVMDYSNCKSTDEMISTLNHAVALIKNIPGRIPRLIDVRNANGSRAFMDAAKRAGEEILNEKTEKAAILGIFGIKKVLLMGYNKITSKKLQPFETKEEALDYLSS